MSESTGGKGDRRRKGDSERFRKNYAEIFKKPRKKPKKKKKEK